MTNTPIARKFIRFIASKTFFVITVLLFVVEAAWIALSARYPQAFDEQFHFGLIQLYSHHLSPFLHGQPTGADQFGAVAHDPSYLYHYLMSFPYRLVAHITSSQTAQIIFLRFINIALFAASIPVFRRVLRYTSASPALINTVLFFFVLTPVAPLLASQLNYDNLVIPVTALSLLLSLRVQRRLQQEGVLDSGLVMGLLIIWLLGSLVKYPFLPIAAGEFLVLAFALWRAHRKKKRVGIFVLTRWKMILAALAVLLSLGLFCQRYAVNVVEFHSISPDCSKALSVSQCKAYAPWARNFAIAKYKGAPVPLSQEIAFPFVWIDRMMGELVFTIGSSFNDRGTVDYYVGTQLILMEVAGWFVFGAGILLAAVYVRRLWKIPALRLFAAVILLYALALIGQNFLDFVRLGQITAVHGRYILPLLPLIYIIIGLAVSNFLTNIRLPRVNIQMRKAALALVFMLILLLEGGSTTYIIRSDDGWLWPQSSAVQKANHKVKKAIKPIVIDKKS